MSARILITLAAIIGLAACAPTHDRYRTGGVYGTSATYADTRYMGSVCRSCGVVERVDVVHGAGHTTGAGAAVGGVVGGVLGSQVGSGSGRTAATIAGAGAGAAVGHNIERGQVRESYELTVRMDDGRRLVVHQRDLRGVRPGARVQVIDGQVRLI
jgi:outer membrane lipoprotein SlyB